MLRRIEPSAGHALFFPRNEGKVVIGQPDFCWFWEEFKHVELGSFKVNLLSSNSFSNFELRTEDNLPCIVQAIFRIEVKQDKHSLEKSTKTCSTSTNIKTKISHEFFIKQVQNILEDIVKSRVEKIASTDLLENSQCVQNLQDEIREVTKDRISEMGFKLLGCSTNIELSEPDIKYLARDSRLLEVWNKYLDEKDKIEMNLLKRELDKIELKTKRENESKIIQDEEYSRFLVKQKKLADEKNKEIRKLNLIEEENKYNADLESAKFQSQQQKLNDDMLKEKFQYEVDRSMQEESRKLDLENFKRDESYKQKKTLLEQELELQKLERIKKEIEQKHRIDNIQDELKIDEFKTQQAELRKKIAETESIQVETLGTAQASVERLKVLAANAHVQEMHKALLSSLPEILEKAYGASEKLGEVKIMYLGGGIGDANSNSSMSIGQPLGTILSSMSTIPMLREVMHFISGWDLSREPNSNVPPDFGTQENNLGRDVIS